MSDIINYCYADYFIHPFFSLDVSIKSYHFHVSTCIT